MNERNFVLAQLGVLAVAAAIGLGVIIPLGLEWRNLVNFALSVQLLLVALVDLRTKTIPNASLMLILLIWVAELGVTVLWGSRPERSLVSMVVGIIAWVVMWQLSAIGGGDMKLLVALMMIRPETGLFLALLAALILGIGLGRLLVRGERAALPLGVWIFVGWVGSLVIGRAS